MKQLIKLALCSVSVVLLSACAEKEPEHTQISQKPPAANRLADAGMKHTSFISSRARVSFEDLALLAEAEVPASHSDADTKRICKRVLGIKICGTANWKYNVNRDGPVQVSGLDNNIHIDIPMSFDGTAGIRGDVAKVLKMDAMDFAGSLNAKLILHLDLAENWCPVIKPQIQYAWTKTPRLNWAAGIDINLQDRLDKAINTQLAALQETVLQSIDCSKFRQQINEQWKPHSLALDLPNTDTVYLNIVPTGFAFSGMNTESDKLGLSFTLEAQTNVESTPLQNTDPLILPPVTRSDYAIGQTRFNVLIKADYNKLQALAAPHLIGQSFTEQSPAGDVSVTINDIEFSGNPSGLTINLGFLADLPATKADTPGNIYLTAKPIADPISHKIRLEDIALSNVIDSTLWNTLATVFNKKIITEIEKRSVLDISEQMQGVSTKIAAQLSDPSRTSGLHIRAESIRASVEEIIAEETQLTTLVRVESLLDIDIPVQALFTARR